MKNGLKMVLAGSLSLALLQAPVRAQDKPAFKDERDKASYAAGLYFGNQIKGVNLDFDQEVLLNTIKEVLAGGEAKLTPQEVREVLTKYQQAEHAKAAEKNRQTGEAFLTDNKSKDGIQTKTITLADGKTAELQYKVITEGTGEIPKSTDTVNVNYRGTFIDGKEFDSSAKHGGQPAKFPVTGVVRGWTEALQLMKVGSKWQVFLPSALAYGDAGRPGIPPASTLIFDMELVSIDAPKPTPTPAPASAPAAPTPPAQPLTSDIIRVPSAEGLKKGEKIEVIKAEDAARQAEAEAAKAKQGEKQP
jgi:FKBP-type peptidyl-prolyl cis-trans isomerase